MSTLTQAQFVELVADKLQISSVGQTLSTEDSEKIVANIPAVLDELAARRVVYVGDDNAIDSAIADPLAEIVKDQCARAFGLQGDPQMRAVHERRLYAIAAGQPTYAVLEGHYF